MYFELKNIGAIKQAKIELGELTVICGKNNTGKTYITYSIYGFLYYSLFMAVEELSKAYSKQLKDIFNVNAEEFSDAKFNIDIDSINFPSPFIISAERTGIQLFQKELDKNKNELIKTLTKTRNLDLLEENIARFALPIEENINFVRDSDNVIKSNSFLKQNYPELITYIEDMLGVQYEIIDGRKVVIDKTNNQVLPHYISSTSVRALFDLHMWLKHKAKKGDILFIDEPELNLHPENQVKIARLFVKLINAGIKVFVTTHSDYIIKELNNLLMFANDFPEKSDIMNQYGYTQNDILKARDLRAYITHLNGTVSPVATDEYGMIESGFDEAIVQTNEISNKIISAIDKLLES
jgi:predicted ATP-dependent endonuclease of OLD family